MAENATDENTSNTLSKSSNSEASEKFSAMIKEGYAAVMSTIRASNSLPKGDQRDMFCTSPKFKPIVDSLGNKSLELMMHILQHQNINRDIRKRDLEEKLELIVDTNDKILERVGTHLDVLAGIRSNPGEEQQAVIAPVNVASGSWNRDVSKSAAWREKKVGAGASAVVLRNARVTHRPQVRFQDKVDNSNSAFVPRIVEKPNSLKPLAILVEALPGCDESYSQPYEFELDRFQEKIDTLELTPKDPQLYKPVNLTPLIMVTEEAQLIAMLEELKTQSEIAVDLEHHSYRSFQGFTCLMQISTREKDYIIDTLELRHKLYILNEVFTNPKIVKVFHGAESDVQWLQRDLCLYVVNMFDTYQAGLVLGLPRLSLAHLLKTYCDVDADKSYQLYDWRTRPLAWEAIKYAREDTHYLLYVFDMLWNKLLAHSPNGFQLLQSVLSRSTETCKQKYWKPLFKEDSYDHVYRSSRKNFDNRQLYALKELYAWRDKTAREEDESIGYVLPNHMMLLIAEQLPKEMQGILACCSPIPPLVRQNLVLLHHIILKAREQPLVVQFTKANNENAARAVATNINLESALFCPHDLTHNEDFRDDLPTLIGSGSPATAITAEEASALIAAKPLLTLFSNEQDIEDGNRSKLSLPNQIHFMSPFDRYKKMLDYIENESKKSKEDREKEIAMDTQKLLDDCMKESLKATAQAALDAVDSAEFKRIKQEEIKQEKEVETSNGKKRSRVDDGSTSDVLSFDTPVKPEQNDSEKQPSNKIKKMDRSMSHVKNKKNTKRVNINTAIKEEDEPVQKLSKSGDQEKPEDDKSKLKELFDYSKVDYSQFQQNQVAQTPKSHQEKFKHKGKKKQQNKSFTFVRNYGSSGGRRN